MEAFALECLKLRLIPGCFVVLLVYLMKDKEHLRVRLEKREDELTSAYQANIRAMERLGHLWDKRACLAGTEGPVGKGEAHV